MRPRIGITQRLTRTVDSNEDRDNLDIQWSRFLWDLGYLPVPLSNYFGSHNICEYISQCNLQGIIFSGGDDIGVWPRRDNFELNLLQIALKKKIPILGVCRGMQILNKFYGGTLEKIEGHVNRPHQISSVIGNRKVNSFHNFAVRNSDLSKKFNIWAKSEDGVIEAIVHQNRKEWGIMWHPERNASVNDLDEIIFKEIFS